MFGNISGNKSNIYERDWSKFDYFSVDWEDLSKIDELNVDNSTKIYLDKLICYQIPMHLLKKSISTS